MTNKKFTLFDALNISFLLLLSIVCVYPFVNIGAVSVSDGLAVASGEVYLFPKGFNIETYKYILSNTRLGVASGLLNSIYYATVGTIFAVVITFMTAYALSRKRFKGRYVIMLIFLFTFIFEAGLVPNYIVNEKLGLVNTRWIMILPPAVNTFLLIITRSFMDTIPSDLEEASFMDGANDYQIMTRVFLPLSKPVLATIGIFYSVTIWNQFLIPMIYLQDRALHPIQLVLYNMIIRGSEDGTSLENLVVNGVRLLPENVQAAAIFLAIIPITLIYPFAQRYFTQGMLLGSVKG